MYFEHLAEFPVSIDLETAGLGTNAPIIAIGAVRFAPSYQTIDCTGPKHEFHTAVNLVGQTPIDPDTFYWWLEQSKDAQLGALEGKGGMTLGNALRALWQWLQADTTVVGRNSNFTGELWIRGDRDALWLEEGFKREGIALPYRFNNVRDQRTIVDFAEKRGVDMPWRDGTQHDALDDARYQAECLKAVFARYPEH
jgi:hypothetical protein